MALLHFTSGCISYPENLAKIVKLDLDDQQTYGKKTNSFQDLWRDLVCTAETKNYEQNS